MEMANQFTFIYEQEEYAVPFNRFCLSYRADLPMKGSITYVEEGKEISDSFFLEAGEREFFCVIGHYLDGKMGSGIRILTLTSCNGEEGKFELLSLTAEEYPVYNGDTHFIENSRFKVGVRLKWGGGINYISNVKNTIPGLTNLVNQCDTGRLIQQSYYGTGPNGEYTPGHFNNANWSYNPVQGGDKYQNHSRIIDIVVCENSVYIKAQPQDWSLDNHITPSYMENTYTLFDEYIRVDNRFVDFSGWSHPCSTQEVPAFYTVSYLDRFTWYAGSRSWTNDALSHRDDLNFWGDPRWSGDCTFIQKRSNTETWCSWTNRDTDYGIGLFVPNADTFFAGRHAYNGSKNPDDGACNYVAPVNRIRMISYKPIEYSYLITTGSVEEIRTVFAANRNFAENRSLHEDSILVRAGD